MSNIFPITAIAPASTPLRSLHFTGTQISVVGNELVKTKRRAWAKPARLQFPDDIDIEQDIWLQERATLDWHGVQVLEPQIASLNPESVHMIDYYNPQIFQFPPGAAVISIKVENLEHIAFAVQKGYWVTAPQISHRLNEVWFSTKSQAAVFLLFSITGGKQYCALAEVKGEVNTRGRIPGWTRRGEKGTIPVSFIYVKNVPFTKFEGIQNGRRNPQPVTNMWNGMCLDYEIGRETVKRYVEFPHFNNILVFQTRLGPCPTWPELPGSTFHYGKNLGDHTPAIVLSTLERLAHIDSLENKPRAPLMPIQVHVQDVEMNRYRDTSSSDSDSPSVSATAEGDENQPPIPSITITPGTGDLPSGEFSQEAPLFSRPNTMHDTRRVVPFYPPGLGLPSMMSGPLQARAIRVQNPVLNVPTYRTVFFDLDTAQKTARGIYQQPGLVRQQVPRLLPTFQPMSQARTSFEGRRNAASHPQLTAAPVFGVPYYRTSSTSSQAYPMRADPAVVVGAKTFDVTSIARQASQPLRPFATSTPIFGARQQRAFSLDSNNSFAAQHHNNAWKNYRYAPHIDHEHRKHESRIVDKVNVSFDDGDLDHIDPWGPENIMIGVPDHEHEYLRLKKAHALISERMARMREAAL